MLSIGPGCGLWARGLLKSKPTVCILLLPRSVIDRVVKYLLGRVSWSLLNGFIVLVQSSVLGVIFACSPLRSTTMSVMPAVRLLINLLGTV